jgi:hypothetical protein
MPLPKFSKAFSATILLLLAGVTLSLSGCALGGFESSAPEPVTGPSSAGAPLQGRAIGGQNPVSGAHLYLFAAGQSATAHNYGTGATSLLTSAVLTNNTAATDASSNTGTGVEDGNSQYYISTDSRGYFSITGDYSCPSAVNGYPAEVYLLAIGGNSGGGANSNIAMMAALGPCVSSTALLSAVPYVTINEITTVAAVWALQQFMSPPSGTAGSINIGAPTTNLVGLQNAFTTAGNLAIIATGLPGSTNSVATPESDHINTLGDILSYCVNATSTSSSNCSNLFLSVTPAGTSLSTKGVAASALNAPADTIQAAWYLAQFPTNIGGTGACGTTAAAFACIQSSGAPFTAMSTTPNDWTLAVGYKPLYNSADAILDPYAVVFDSYGNAWVDNIDTTAGESSVVPLAPSGAAIYAPVTSYPVGANSGYSAYLATTYGTTTAAAYTHTIDGPRGMTVDSNGNVWLADYNAELTTGETAISGGTGTNCASDCFFGTVAKFPAATGIGTASSSGVVGYYSPLWPWPAAADANGNVYFSSGYNAVGTRAFGVFNSSAAYTQGGLDGVHTFTMVIDNNTSNTNGPFIWTDVQSGCAVGSDEASLIDQFATGIPATKTTYSGLAGTNTGCTGSDIIPASTGAVLGMAIDSSNNIWLVNESIDSSVEGETGPTGAINTVTYGVVSKPATGTGVWINTAASAYASVMSSAGLAGMNNPQFAEVDGAGNLWVSNFGTVSVAGSGPISEVNVTGAGTSSIAINSLSGTTGFVHSETASALYDSQGIAIDLSGNVWVAGSGGSSIHYLTVLVGAATPVGPLIPGQLGVAP